MFTLSPGLEKSTKCSGCEPWQNDLVTQMRHTRCCYWKPFTQKGQTSTEAISHLWHVLPEAPTLKEVSQWEELFRSTEKHQIVERFPSLWWFRQSSVDSPAFNPPSALWKNVMDVSLFSLSALLDHHHPYLLLATRCSKTIAIFLVTSLSLFEMDSSTLTIVIYSSSAVMDS